MKTTFALAALAAGAVAVPSGHRHLHQNRRQEARDVVVETDVVYATAPQVMVYVDANGNPFSTSTVSVTEETQAPVQEVEAAAEPTEEAVAAYEPEASPKEESTSDSRGLGSGHGIVYSPYNGDGTCKSQDQVNSDFRGINGYDTVRIYGVDCNQVTTVLNAARSKGMGIFAGIFNIDQVSNEVQTLIEAAQGNWGSIETVSVGNEGVNNGQYSVSAVASAVNTARSALRAAGYNGPVVTVDTFVAIISNPALCDVGDYVAANCHAFFDGGVTAQNAGDFVLTQAQRVSNACGGKHTVITETGWPSQGASNRNAIPSRQNQADAIASIENRFSNNVILFTAYNDHWKSNFAGSYGAEQFWGIYGDSSA